MRNNGLAAPDNQENGRREWTMQKNTSSGLLSIFCGLLLLFLAPAWAADVPEISTEALKGMLDARQSLLLVHSLSDIEFDQAHIPGSINIPVGEMLKTDKLPQDKETLLVFY
jgi:hypothetical protein